MSTRHTKTTTRKNNPCQSNPHTHTHTRSRAHWNTLSWTHTKSWIMDNARSCTDKVTHVVPHNQIDPLAKDYVVGTCVGKTRGRRDDHQRHCIHLHPPRVHEIRAESNDFSFTTRESRETQYEIERTVSMSAAVHDTIPDQMLVDIRHLSYVRGARHATHREARAREFFAQADVEGNVGVIRMHV